MRLASEVLRLSQGRAASLSLFSLVSLSFSGLASEALRLSEKSRLTTIGLEGELASEQQGVCSRSPVGSVEAKRHWGEESWG